MALKPIPDKVNANDKTWKEAYVVLGANIDMKNEAWEPIGANSDTNVRFFGVFNGQGHTIYNLKVSLLDPEYRGSGLFGSTGGTLQNFTVDGANISAISGGSATDNGIAVVAGSLYSSGTISNVHVKNATLSGNRYLGGIAGYVYGNISGCTVENITITATPNPSSDGYDNGDKCGGIVGYLAGSSSSVSGCSVSGATISGYRDIGGIAGINNTGNNSAVNSCSVSGNISLTADQTINYYGDKTFNVHPIIGRVEGGVDHAGVNNSSANATVSIVNKPQVAQIEGSDTIYRSIDAAVAAANPGDTSVLINDVTSAAPIAIPAGKDIILNMNGKDITITSGTRVFENEGTITLMAKGNINVSFDIYGGDDVINAEDMINAAGQVAYSLDNLKLAEGSSVTFAKDCISIIDSDDMPELPTATVTEIENENLTYAMNFLAKEVTDEQLAAYSLWFADYELSINKDVTFYTGDPSDGWLSGQYDSHSDSWMNVPFNEAADVEANTPIRIMEYAAKSLNQPGLKFTYGMIYELVRDFNCGIFFKDDFLNDPANVDLEIKLELRMYNPLNENESVVIGDYSFANPNAVVSLTSGSTTSYYGSFDEAYADAKPGDTITLHQDIESSTPITIEKTLTIDGGGNSLTYTGSNRAITVEAGVDADLTVKNLDIVMSNDYSQRGINYNTTGTLTIENVSISDGDGGSNTTYAINLPSSASGAKVNISDSDIRGKIALNVWGDGIAVSITDSDLYTIDNNPDEDYAVIKFNNDGTSSSGAWSLSLSGGSLNYVDNGSVNLKKPAISNSSLAKSLHSNDAFSNTGCTLNGKLSEPVAITTHEADSDFYSMESLQEAVDAAVKYNVSIELLRNVELNEELVLSGDVVLHTKGMSFSIGENGSISFEGEASTLTLADLEGTDAQLAAYREALPGLCIYKGSVVIAKSHTAPTGSSCADTVECTKCGADINNESAALHSLKYALETGKTNVIVETCQNCDHRATAKIDLKDAKKSNFSYTGKPIEALADSYSVKSNTSDSWLGGTLAISYLNASNEASNVDPGTALGKISITGSDKVTATASMSFTITPEKLDSWEHNDFYRDSGKSLSFTIETDYRYAPGYVVTLGIYNSADKLVATVPQSSLGAKFDKNGDVVVTVPASVMSKLSTGRYTMKAELVSPSYNDADEMIVTAETEEEFRVRYPRIIPSTGDPANFLLWGGMLLAATAVLGGSAIALKKSKKQK